MANAIHKIAERIMLRNAIWSVFGVSFDITMREVGTYLYTGADNPRGYAPAADWVVYTNSQGGIPNPVQYPSTECHWQTVVDRLSERLDAKAVWFESVNASAIAIYVE
jgi:hypothetical protein